MTQPTDRPTREETTPQSPITILPPDSPSYTTAYAAPTRPTRSGCLWGVGGALGCLGLVLLIPTVLVLIGVTTFGGLLGGIGSFLGANSPASAEVVTSQTIVQGIQPLGQLVSVSAQLAKADVYVGVGQGVMNACGHGANHVVQGAVDAGIDLTQIGEGDIAYDPELDRYLVIVPAPQLTSCRVEYMRQYDRTTTQTVCGVDWDEVRLLANHVALEEFRDDAIEGGILQRAEQEARLVLGNFIQLVTGKQVEIVFRPVDPENTTFPPSCTSETPEGWRFNPTNGHWEK